jgi:hypothetical protein
MRRAARHRRGRSVVVVEAEALVLVDDEVLVGMEG